MLEIVYQGKFFNFITLKPILNNSCKNKSIINVLQIILDAEVEQIIQYINFVRNYLLRTTSPGQQIRRHTLNFVAMNSIHHK